MKITFSDYPVLVPYKTLEELTKLVHEYNKLRKELEIIRSQLLSLRMIQQECIEKIGEIERYL